MLPTNVNPLMMTRQALWAQSVKRRDLTYRKQHEARADRRQRSLERGLKKYDPEKVAPEVSNNTWKPSMEWRISGPTQDDPSKITPFELRLFLRAWGLSTTLRSVAYRLNIPMDAVKAIGDHIGLSFTDLNQIQEEMALKLFLQDISIQSIVDKMRWTRKGVKRAIETAYKRRWDPSQNDIMIPWLPPPMDYREVKIIHVLHSDDRLWDMHWKIARLSGQDERLVDKYMDRAALARRAYDRHYDL